MAGPTGARARFAAALARFFAPQPQQGMVAARIGFGLVLFGAWVSKAPALQALYGPEGVGGFASHQRAPGLAAGRPLEAAWQHLHRLESPEAVTALWVLLLLASGAFAAGYRTRLAGLVALGLHALFQARSYAVMGDWAVMIKPWLLYVILAPSGRRLSVDAWLRARRGLGEATSWLGPAAPVRLLQVHLCTMYAMAGWSRLANAEWLSGEVVFSILTDRFYGRFDVDWLPWLPALRLLTWGVYALEPVAPILLWVPRFRGVTVLALIGLHVGMELFTNADWWQPMMLSALAVFFPWAATGGLVWERLLPLGRRGAPRAP